MHRYSRFRIYLLTMLLAAATFLVVRSGMAQDAVAPETPAPVAPAAQADTTTATPAAPAAGAATSEGTGLMNIIMGNLDFVFFTIIALSVAGLTLILQGFIKNRESVFMPPRITILIREMIAQRQFAELQDFTDRDRTFVSKALAPALRQYPSFTGMKEAMETAIGEQTAEQFRKIEYLNIIGNLGPLLGLLGTVLGMIEAFSAMEAAKGAANPSQLAGGISKALAHTFMGLMLAVPCLAAFGILRTQVDRLTVKGALVAEELLLMFKPAPAPTAATTASLPPAARPAPAVAGARRPLPPTPPASPAQMM